ncbi:MAG: hypothetical protein ACE5H1_00200 [Thermodesulfobacteriota bacterium]
MSHISEIHYRRSIRLKGYDYSHPGAYFITICTRNRGCLFGEIIDGKMRLNEWGHEVEHRWKWLCSRYEYIKSDAWIVMPNHYT